MYLTEDEAKKIGCPVGLIATLIGTGIATQAYCQLKESTTLEETKSAIDTASNLRTCIASDCMMWRWKLPTSNPQTINKWGYCGLAGKPE